MMYLSILPKSINFLLIGLPAIRTAHLHHVGLEPVVKTPGVEVMIAIKNHNTLPLRLVIEADYAVVLVTEDVMAPQEFLGLPVDLLHNLVLHHEFILYYSRGFHYLQNKHKENEIEQHETNYSFQTYFNN